jgi:putative nucleotidyltransferase with HDIG domain
VMENCEYILNHLGEFFGELSAAVAGDLAKDRRLPLLKLAALLHDVGKPAKRAVNPTSGRITFYGHDDVGAEIVAGIAERLKMANRDRDYLRLLVAEHLHVLNLSPPHVNAQTISKWLRQLRDDVIPVVILGISDIKGTLGPDSTEDATTAHISWSRLTLKRYFEVARKQLERKDLVTGKDLIALGIQPGPGMGRILAVLREAQDADEIATKEDALKLAQTLRDSQP